nr:PH domain-containing protein [Nocardioides thalensis]
MWRVECALGAVVPLVALLVAALTWREYGARWLVVGAAAIVAAAYVLVVPHWRYLVHRWEITETAVYTQRGWWARERRIAPMSRVQTVDLAQGPLARLFGLATLTVTTASAAGALKIDGLDHTTAVGLVDQLTVQAEAAGGDAT